MNRLAGILKALVPAATLAAVLFYSTGMVFASVAGRAIFVENGCGGCHQTEGPAREKTIADQLAKKGPELWYAGSKFRPGFLASWLAGPAPIRPMEYYSLTEKNRGDHPRLSPQQASEVAAYLMGLTSSAVEKAEIDPRLARRGKKVFVKKQSCYGCHRVMNRGKAVGGFTGPSLVGASVRLEPSWVYAYLKDPKVFKPVRDMPDYNRYLKDEEFMALAAYISTLE